MSQINTHESNEYTWVKWMRCLHVVIYMSHTTHQMNEMVYFTTWMNRSCVAWCIHRRHDSFVCDKTHGVHCDMNGSCIAWLIHLLHDSFVCDITHGVFATWIIHVRDMMHLDRTWPIYMWRERHAYILDVTYLYLTWKHMDMTYPYVTWRNHMCVGHDPI